MKIYRSITPKIIKNLEKEDILLIVGARQVGKTTLLKQLIKVFKERSAQYFYFTLEDRELLEVLDKHPNNIFQYIPQNTQKTYLLIDEIQYLKDPSNFLKYIYDQYKNTIKLIVTGSSAFYIDKKFKDSLAGRKKIIKLYPFNFSEFLLSKGASEFAEKINQPTFIESDSKRNFLVPDRKQLEIYWNEYVLFGGYPKIVMESDYEEKQDYLKELYQSFLKKDVLDSGIKEEIAFYKLIKILASQTGQLVNNQELARTVGVSGETISKYLYVLQKSFIIQLIPTFSGNMRKELVKMPKVFFFDNGYRNALLNSFSLWGDRLDKGELLENSVFVELTKNSMEDIKFWRTQDKQEIDFIVNEKYAFEVKLNKSSFKAAKYKTFKNKYPDIDLKLVTYSDFYELDIFDFISLN